MFILLWHDCRAGEYLSIHQRLCINLDWTIKWWHPGFLSWPYGHQCIKITLLKIVVKNSFVNSCFISYISFFLHCIQLTFKFVLQNRTLSYMSFSGEKQAIMDVFISFNKHSLQTLRFINFDISICFSKQMPLH